MQKQVVASRHLYVLVVFVVSMVWSLGGMQRTTLAEMKVPKDLTLSATGDQPPVVFSHKTHVVDHALKCTECHVKLFQMKAGGTAEKHGKLTMDAMAQGQFCGACHNGKRAFSVQTQDTCTRCHVRK